MQQPQPVSQGPPPSSYSELQIALNPVVRQLERLEDRLQRDMETLRRDVEKLRDDFPQFAAMEARLKALEDERATRVERFWMKVGPIATLAAIIIPLIEFLTRYRLIGSP